MRGRKATPTVLRVLRGNPGKRAFNKAEPESVPMDAECPAELSDEVARAEWARIIVPLVAIGQITAADRVMAIAHCQLWATWRSQSDLADRHPHVISSGKNSYPIPNPARGMANKTLMMLTTIDAELGLTPTTRSRVKASPMVPKSKVEQFLSSKTGA